MKEASVNSMKNSAPQALVFWPFNAFGARTGTHQVQLSDLMALITLGYQVTLFGSELFGDPDTAWNIDDIDKLEEIWGVKVHLSKPGLVDRLFHAHQRAIRVEHWDIYQTPWLLEEFRQVFDHIKPDLVVVHYAWWGQFAMGKEFASATRILRSHDVLSVNDKVIQKVLPFLKAPSFPEHVDPIITAEDFYSDLIGVHEPQSEEYQVYDSYDGTVGITPADVHVIKQQTSHTTVCDVPPALSVKDLGNSYDGDPIFVGSDNPLNIQGYVFFVLQVLPEVLRKRSDFSLKAIGGFSRKVAKVSGTELLGYVTDLKPHYTSAPFSICPMLGGTGIQIKILESMAHGVPVIAMKAIAQASPIQHGVNGYIANNAEEFCQYVIQLSDDRTLCKKLGDAARGTIAEQFSLNQVVEKWKVAISSAKNNREDKGGSPMTVMQEHCDLEKNTHTTTSSGKSGKVHPKISVVTPTKNCARYIRGCIESVLEQNYDNFEHIIVDGASTDKTVQILKEYPHLKWVSEPDDGEAEALNKALAMVDGDIISWLNADDNYFGTEVFRIVAQEMSSSDGKHLVYGKTLLTDEQQNISWLQIPRVPITLPILMRWFDLHELYQPSMFYSKQLIQTVGQYREDLFFSIDYEYWLRIAAQGISFHYVDHVLSQSRLFRKSGKSALPRKEQEESWTQTATAFQHHLLEVERIKFWKDFYHYQLPYLKQSNEPITPPNDEWAQIGLALVLRGRGVGSEVVKLLQETIKQAPDCSDAFWLLGDEILRTFKDVNRAKPILEAAEMLTWRQQEQAVKSQPTTMVNSDNIRADRELVVTETVAEKTVPTINFNWRMYANSQERPLRVLFQIRPNSSTHPGGDTLVMNKLRDGLGQRGIQVDLTSEISSLAGYDLVHLFNFATPQFTNQCAQEAVQAGIPFVVTAMFEDWPRFLSKCCASLDLFKDYFDNGFDEQKFVIHLNYIRCLPPAVSTENSFAACHAACLFASGEAERRRLLEVYPNSKRVEVVKLGMDHLNANVGAELFCGQYHVKDYVLCVGRLETRKNQLMLLKALQYEQMPIVFVTGGVSYQPEYEDLCRRFPRKGSTIFVGRLSDDMLASCYRGAKVFCLPSWYELPGIVTVEAARFGCSVVASSWGTIKDYLPYGVHYCEPDNPNSIREAILDAFSTPHFQHLQADARQFTWDRTVDELVSQYHDILNRVKQPLVQDDSISHSMSHLEQPLSSQSDVNLKEAQTALAQGRLDEAKELLEPFIQCHPYHSEAWLVCGVLSMQYQNYKKAVDAFNAALRYGADDRKCRMGLAMALMGQGVERQSQMVLLEVLTSHPDDEEAIHWLIRVCTALEDWAKLESSLGYYLKRNPANYSIRFALASVLVKQRKMSEAQSHLDTLKLLNPDFAGLEDLQEVIERAGVDSTIGELSQKRSA